MKLDIKKDFPDGQIHHSHAVPLWDTALPSLWIFVTSRGPKKKPASRTTCIGKEMGSPLRTRDAIHSPNWPTCLLRTPIVYWPLPLSRYFPTPYFLPRPLQKPGHGMGGCSGPATSLRLLQLHQGPLQESAESFPAEKDQISSH